MRYIKVKDINNETMFLNISLLEAIRIRKNHLEIIYYFNADNVVQIFSSIEDLEEFVKEKLEVL